MERLTRETVESGLPRNLAEAFDAFEPLPFDAARGAKDWLRSCIDQEEDPMVTVFALDPDRKRLCGFFVLGFTTITLAPGDRPIVEVAHKLKEPHAPQIAAEIAWIARDRSTERGFGRDLFDYAVALAIDYRAIAMVVTPHDDRTAEKLWVNRYRFRPPRQVTTGSEQVQSKLWYPVYKYEASWPS